MPKKSIRSLEDLVDHELIHKDSDHDLNKVIDQFSLAITPEIAELISKDEDSSAITKQFVPSIKELEYSPSESTDPIGDTVYTQVKGIIHRYPDRCLLTPVHVCPVYCRFCFRREKVSHATETLTPNELKTALQYIQDHKEIWEVILTGGDPLILKPSVLKKLFNKITAIEHVEVIRIHTRVPVVDSKRINHALIAALQCAKPVFIVLHANHPKEFTESAIKACNMLVDAGFPMLSQTVLLKDINDNIETLSALMKYFVKNRIKPYYLHQGDLARGTQHFRTSIAKGQALMKQLRGRFSGLCQPEYVLDIPGGYGKIPLTPNYIHQCQHEGEKTIYKIEDYQENLHIYELLP